MAQSAWRRKSDDVRLNWSIFTAITVFLVFWAFFFYGVLTFYHNLARKFGEFL
jgi:hypothetical protein